MASLAIAGLGTWQRLSRTTHSTPYNLRAEKQRINVATHCMVAHVSCGPPRFAVSTSDQLPRLLMERPPLPFVEHGVGACVVGCPAHLHEGATAHTAGALRDHAEIKHAEQPRRAARWPLDSPPPTIVTRTHAQPWHAHTHPRPLHQVGD